jgi:GTP:adenosylcobinamide-phosphate guanylyltransferase
MSSYLKINIIFNCTIAEAYNGGELKYGGINVIKSLMENLKMNCIPETISSMDINSYEDFLKQRRILTAKKIKEYYFSL